jgi:hypothetical protein
MPHAHDNDATALDPIADDVGTDEGKLAYSRSRHRPATIWKIGQALGRLNECFGQRLS